MQSFPEYFLSANSHMVLIDEGDDRYTMSPPNQCDWNYTIERAPDDSWNVRGVKNDALNGESEVYSATFVWNGSLWRSN